MRALLVGLRVCRLAALELLPLGLGPLHRGGGGVLRLLGHAAGALGCILRRRKPLRRELGLRPQLLRGLVAGGVLLRLIIRACALLRFAARRRRIGGRLRRAGRIVANLLLQELEALLHVHQR